MNTIHVATLAELPQAARQIIAHFLPPVNRQPSLCIALYAPMGAGKTTLVSAIAHELGITDPVTSPTFAIVNEYTFLPSPVGEGAGVRPLYHFDFYRLRNLQEALDIGVEDYFYSGNPCIIEWPELIEPILPADTLRISIRVNPDGSRDIIPVKE